MTDRVLGPPLRIFLLAVEESGDQLGAALMRALRARQPDVQISGVGGHRMAAEGLASLHTTDDFSIMGVSAIPARLPRILRHYRATMRAIAQHPPDVLVAIDSPGYSLRVARAVRRRHPNIRIVDYVSPSVWAWRPSRAPAMRRYVDHILALLPFEPEVHRRLSGPPCSYVGHPIVEQAMRLRPDASEMARRAAAPPVLLILPGSRSGEIRRLAGVFGEAAGRVQASVGDIEVVVPTAPHLEASVRAATASWPVVPRVVTGQEEKLAAFRIARAALTKSGTVTLELAVAGVPMVTAYKVSAFDAFLARRLVRVPSVVLANLVLGENVVPEFLQELCTADRLAGALASVMGDTPERERQLEAFSGLDAIMGIGQSDPATRAAEIVLAQVRN